MRRYIFTRRDVPHAGTVQWRPTRITCCTCNTQLSLMPVYMGLVVARKSAVQPTENILLHILIRRNIKEALLEVPHALDNLLFTPFGKRLVNFFVTHIIVVPALAAIL